MSAILFKISPSMRDFYSILPCTIAQNVVPVRNLSLHTRNVNPHSMNFSLQIFNFSLVRPYIFGAGSSSYIAKKSSFRKSRLSTLSTSSISLAPS